MLTTLGYEVAGILRNYSRIFTGQKEYLLSVTLKTIEEKLSQPFFMRIHRSYLVNLMQRMQTL
ncbi:LytTR family transcriptional regulator DNA-binding domain-containing protein [Larkinella rosea]|uniref:LytTR family transcriptional regulator DNA-binding domain-containing protein n=1 Tax=Larkinella rosea TaxID=2025312 RepID=UPI001C8AC891|nr:LytTR family DNA-binding domain-containing protein [Larkinella rosea]